MQAKTAVNSIRALKITNLLKTNIWNMCKWNLNDINRRTKVIRNIKNVLCYRIMFMINKLNWENNKLRFAEYREIKILYGQTTLHFSFNKKTKWVDSPYNQILNWL